MSRLQMLLALLLYGNGTPRTEAQGDLPISNLPVYSDGIYFEKLKPVKIQISTWTLQAEYELQVFIDEITLANSSVAKLINACREMREKFPGSCESIENIIDLTRELNDFQNLLRSFCEADAKKRNKRGILKSWFGLMDDEDRDEIDDNFKKVDQQLLTQSSTVKDFFNSTNKAIAALSGNVFQVDPKKPGTIDFTREGQLLMMDILLNKIIRKKDLFMKLLQASSSVTLSDDIVNPSRLLMELQKLQKILPEDFTFPVELILRDVTKIYPLSKVVAYVDGCKMKVNILLPLCNKIKYTTLKGTSLPMLQNGILKMYPLENDVLVYSEGHNLGMVMNYGDYKSCDHLHDFALCNTHQLMKNLTSAEDCIVTSFFNRTTMDSDCRVSRLQLRHQLWIQLADPNKWIYAVPNRTTIDVNYGLGNVGKVQLEGVGILTMVRMCHVRSQDIVLQYVPQLHGNIAASSLGYHLPAVVTRDQPRTISASDTNKVILAGKSTESALQESTHVAGIHYERPTFSPWAIVGIVGGVFIVAAIAVQGYLKMLDMKRRQQGGVVAGYTSDSPNHSQRAMLAGQEPSAPPYA